MMIFDSVPITGVTVTARGLVAEAFVARSGIQVYNGHEVGMNDRATVRVWRPEDEVKKPESVYTYSHAPITLGHPTVLVDAKNVRELGRGHVIATEAVWIDGKLKLPLIVEDAEAIQAVQDGVRELSAGYTSRIEIADGVTPEGEPYDAIQRDIRINHLAIVPAGRAGKEFRIGDGAGQRGTSPSTHDKEVNMTDKTIAVVLGDAAVTLPATEAPAVQAFADAMRRKVSDMETAHTTALGAKDREIGEKDAKIAELEKAQLSDAQVVERATALAKVISDAKSIAPKIETAGLSEAAIRKAAVTARLGDAAVQGKSDDWVGGVFDSILIQQPAAQQRDPLRETLMDRRHAKPAEEQHDEAVFKAAGVKMKKEA